MQNRLVRKLDLEIALSKIKPHSSPKAYLEQYTISPEVAAELLYIATYTYDDIIDKTIVDLGCGTGRLAIGSCLMGAKETIGVDIDKIATKTALKNAEKLNVKGRIQWVTADITAIHGSFDTVLQNPPFGVRKRKADRKFLEKALEIGRRIYSLHKSSQKNRKLARKLKTSNTRFTTPSSSSFLKSFIEKHGGQIKAVYTLPMTIPHMFEFHRKRRHQFLVDLYIIET
jgi:putative methylase